MDSLQQRAKKLNRLHIRWQDIGPRHWSPQPHRAPPSVHTLLRAHSLVMSSEWTSVFPNVYSTASCLWSVGRQRKRFKDTLKASLKDINPESWKGLAAERCTWRSLIRKGAISSEKNRVSQAGSAKQGQPSRGAPQVWGHQRFNTRFSPWLLNVQQNFPCPDWPYQSISDTSPAVIRPMSDVTVTIQWMDEQYCPFKGKV